MTDAQVTTGNQDANTRVQEYKGAMNRLSAAIVDFITKDQFPKFGAMTRIYHAMDTDKYYTWHEPYTTSTKGAKYVEFDLIGVDVTPVDDAPIDYRFVENTSGITVESLVHEAVRIAWLIPAAKDPGTLHDASQRLREFLTTAFGRGIKNGLTEKQVRTASTMIGLYARSAKHDINDAAKRLLEIREFLRNPN